MACQRVPSIFPFRRSVLGHEKTRGCPWKPNVFFACPWVKPSLKSNFHQVPGVLPRLVCSIHGIHAHADWFHCHVWLRYLLSLECFAGGRIFHTLSLYLSIYLPTNLAMDNPPVTVFFVQPSSQRLSANLFFSKSKCLLVKIDNHWSIFSMDVWWPNPPISWVRNIYRTSQCLADHNPWFSVNFILIGLGGEIFQKGVYIYIYT